ncbi:MAG: hypothetical protein P9L92_01350 [Candidatus Electryonea clarkiae]|nr:hypothetical protein [Candidatus Electryonea clarkiae]MDP8287468.1 hypothetical protein [Candidatus Electryonea clarkiae]
MKQSAGWLEGLARVLLGALFLFRAGRLLFPSGAEDAMKTMMEAGLPAVPFLFSITLTLLLLGSLGLVLGYRTKSAALVLLILYILNAFISFPPWVSGNLTLFLLRCGIMGGLLLVIVHGPGKFSFDAQSMVPVRRKRA